MADTDETVGGHAWRTWERAETADWIAVPGAGDDKYSRGVLGVITGSDPYPGAAVLGVEAAVRAGVGMLRYLGDPRPTGLVLQRRPEVVTVPGRVQAWLVGSGMDAGSRDAAMAERLRDALEGPVPTVIDAGALDLIGAAAGPVVITPHFRELSRVLDAYGESADPAVIAADPRRWARRGAELTGAVVLLKGGTTHVAGPGAGHGISVTGGPAWLATAGSGDVLGGILGALVATHSRQVARDGHAALVELAAAAAALHALAGAGASAGGPIAALDIAEALPNAVRRLLGGAANR